jgi:hypothetical protein
MTIHKTASSGGRPPGSIKDRTPPLGTDVVKVVQAAWGMALKAPKNGREIFEAFIEAFDRGEIGGHYEVLVPVVKEIEALLKDSKLEGKPLNYVKRTENEQRDYAVCWAFDHFRTAKVKVDKPDGAFEMPERDCAEAVAKGFGDAGIANLTVDNVLQIWKRARLK